jgi:Mrp family chromosome partitioning ATPase
MFQRKNPAQAPAGQNPLDTVKAVKDAEESEALRRALARISHKFIVLSGKGGVGKSTVAVNLAFSLAEKNRMTGLLDIDIHGPSVPKLLGIEDKKPSGTAEGKIFPVDYSAYLKVISIGFLLQKPDDAVIWRGPLKYGIIKQFLNDVEWGDLDYLVIDSPPGTGDEPLSVCQLIENPDGAVIVTTPQDVSVIDVRKSISFCRQLNIPVLGVIENMSGFICPHCGKDTAIFKIGGGEEMARDMGVPFLGRIPLDAGITRSGDGGMPFSGQGSDAAPGARTGFERIVEALIQGGRS